MIFQEPPLRIDFTLTDPAIQPEGLMKPYLGSQYDSMKIAEANQEFEEDTTGYRYLRAFPVSPLIGAEFKVKGDTELASGLRDLLNQILLPIEFEKVEVNPLVLRKYHFIHTSVPAPPDVATSQPMAIEIYAYLVDLKAPVGSYEHELFDLLKKGDPIPVFEFKESMFSISKKDNDFHIPGYMKHELVGIMTLRISEAVYSNIMHPNITGGFYL